MRTFPGLYTANIDPLNEEIKKFDWISASAEVSA